MSNVPPIPQLMRTAHFAAWQAGQIIRDTIANPPNVRDKGPRDRVTDTDFASQEAIFTVIHSTYPDHSILSEEDTQNHHRKGNLWDIPDGIVWVIDPLDGTTNFGSSLPFVCVSIGVAIDGTPVAGVIADPLRQEYFVAGVGAGATLNGQLLPGLRPTTLDDSVICLDWSHAPPGRSLAYQCAGQLANRCRTLRSLGSAALSLAYVAAGRLDLYFNFGLQPWDITAGAVIVTEAGGRLASPEGADWSLRDRSLVAAHPSLLNEVIPVLRPIMKNRGLTG